jgi:Tfp pilus assembly protein PilZ
VAAIRLELQLSHQSDWIKIFDPRDWTIFVPTGDAVEHGTSVRIDLDVGGWRVALRGIVVGRRDAPAGVPAGVVVALGGTERDKINYLNGFVRGGLINLREKRRLPIKLAVTYGAVEGPASTFTKDINEEGVFLFTERPLPETSQVHMLLTLPDRPQPLSLIGKVSHTIVAADDEPPGMGIVFDLDDAARDQLIEIVRELEAQLHAGKLPTSTVE